MSHEIDETYRVYDEQTRRARKPHACSACEEPIRVGDRYVYVTIVDSDGNGVEHLKRCARCQAIHLHLRAIDPGVLWPNERLDCGEEYEAHWGMAPPAHVAALAFWLPGDPLPTEGAP